MQLIYRMNEQRAKYKIKISILIGGNGTKMSMCFMYMCFSCNWLLKYNILGSSLLFQILNYDEWNWLKLVFFLNEL